MLDESESTTSQYEVRTFLIDEENNDRVLLTPEQIFIASQQIDFTSRSFVSFLTKIGETTIVSQPIRWTHFAVEKRDVFEKSIVQQLNRFDREFHYDEVHRLIETYVQHRSNEVRIQQKTIEFILPILGQFSNFLQKKIVKKRKFKFFFFRQKF